MHQRKIIEIIISGSVGELDWILPIAKYLSESGRSIRVSFLKKSARESFKNNSTIRNIASGSLKINEETLLSDSQLKIWEFLNRLYRLLSKISYKIFFNHLEKFFSFLNKIFFKRLHLIIKNDPSCVIVEYPSDRRLLGAILRGNNIKTIYFPHSPHIYSKENNQSSEKNFIRKHNKCALEFETYLFGSENDIHAIIKEGWSPVKKSKILITGHPKYSKSWIKYFKDQVDINSNKESFKIGILSRGVGNFLSKQEHERLIEDIHKAITKIDKNLEVKVKLHPREVLDVNTSWSNFLSNGFHLTDDHIFKIFSEVDLIIMMWSSAALDAAIFNIPVIEMYDPNTSFLGQVKRGNKFNTIYDLSGLVETAKNEKELSDKILEILNGNKFNLNRSNSVEELINRSDNWVQIAQDDMAEW